ncbi:hypothetical protein JCM10449v2_006656 [Rhodotorula kratochvilovae]
MVKLTLTALLAAAASVALVGAAPLVTSADALAVREARMVKVRALRDAVDDAGLTKRQGNSAFGHAQGNGPPANRGNGKGRGNGNDRPGNGNGRGNNGNENGGGRGNGNGNGHGNGHGNGNGNGNGGNNDDDDDVDTDNDVNNCGRRWFVCPQSYNGVGEPVCDYGNCRLRCPPGWVNFLNNNPQLPNFCAEQD